MSEELGFVYIYNLMFVHAELTLDNRRIPTVPAAISGGYPPPFVILDRNSLASSSTNEFGESNTLDVIYDGARNSYRILLPERLYPLANDVRLYLYSDGLVLAHENESKAIAPQ